MEVEVKEPQRRSRTAKPPPLREIALLFLKLGSVAFGGPAAHIAMMEDEVVRKRRWLFREEFLDLLGATNLIPGPNSTELAIHIGHRQAGWAGLIVAGVCFILPAALIVCAVAWAYVHYGSLPQADAILYGIKPVIIAIVLQALWRLGRAALKTKLLALVGAAGIVLSLLGVNELAVLFGAGAAVGLVRWLIKSSEAEQKRKGARKLFAFPFAFFTQGTVTAGTMSFGCGHSFSFFLR
jgi:chromate transporter